MREANEDTTPTRRGMLARLGTVTAALGLAATGVASASPADSDARLIGLCAEAAGLAHASRDAGARSIEAADAASEERAKVLAVHPREEWRAAVLQLQAISPLCAAEDVAKKHAEAADEALNAAVQAICAITPVGIAGYSALARLALTIAEPYRPISDEREDVSLSFVPEPLIAALLHNLAEVVA